MKSKCDYCLPLYTAAAPTTLSTLNVIHHTALRLATSAFRTIPVISLYCETGELPVHLHRSLVLLKFFLRLQQLPKTLIEKPSTSDSSKPHVKKLLHRRANQTLTNLDLPSLPPIQHDIHTSSPPWKSTIINYTSPAITNEGHNLNYILTLHYDYLISHISASSSVHGCGCAYKIQNSSWRFPLPGAFSALVAELYAIVLVIEELVSYSLYLFITGVPKRAHEFELYS